MIDKIAASALPIKPLQAAANPAGTGAAEVGRSFGELLNNALNQLTVQEAEVGRLNTQFITGEPVDVHQLMINSEKLALGLDLTVQVRNKVIDAYQEIMRMQV